MDQLNSSLKKLVSVAFELLPTAMAPEKALARIPELTLYSNLLRSGHMVHLLHTYLLSQGGKLAKLLKELPSPSDLPDILSSYKLDVPLAMVHSLRFDEFMNAGLSAWLNRFEGGRVRFQDLENECLYFYPQDLLHIGFDCTFITREADKGVAGSRVVFFDAKKATKRQNRTGPQPAAKRRLVSSSSSSAASSKTGPLSFLGRWPLAPNPRGV